MKTGYPRFFIPRIVHQLAMRLLERQQSEQLIPGAEQPGERLAILLDTVRHAQLCRKVLPEWNAPGTERFSPADIGVYVVTWEGRMTAVKEEENRLDQPPSSRDIGEEDIVQVSYPAQLALQAKAFWQHTGFGISSRRATHWLENAPFLNPQVPKSTPSPEERSRSVSQARAALKERTATGQSSPTLPVTPSDVFLFPTGMTAIAELADAIKSLRRSTRDTPYRVAVFGSVSPPHPSSSTPTNPFDYHPASSTSTPSKS
jgi:cystathionine gamma-synthase